MIIGNAHNEAFFAVHKFTRCHTLLTLKSGKGQRAIRAAEAKGIG